MSHLQTFSNRHSERGIPESSRLRVPAVAQYGSIVAILAIVMKFRSRYAHGNYIFGVLAIYAAAKAAEAFDAQIHAIGQFVSGHTFKHLLAAAVFWLLRMLHLRRPQ